MLSTRHKTSHGSGLLTEVQLDGRTLLGLAPRQRSTGAKQRLGNTSKMGQRDIRRLPITGSMAVIRRATCRSSPKSSWLARMLERKPLSVVAVALANKIARGMWAMLTRDEDYRGPLLIGA